MAFLDSPIIYIYRTSRYLTLNYCNFEKDLRFFGGGGWLCWWWLVAAFFAHAALGDSIYLGPWGFKKLVKL